MEFDIKKALEYYEKENNITLAAKKHCEDLGIEYGEKYRIKLSVYIRNMDKKVDEDLENTTDTNQYGSVSQLSALKPDGTIMNIEEYCDFYKIPFNQVRTYKLVTHTSKGAYYNIASSEIKSNFLDEFQKNLLDQLANVENLPGTLVRNKIEDESFLLVLDPADIHIGKLAESFETGEDYNNQIAVQRVKEGVDGILDKIKGYKIDKILFIGGNDILHIDSPKRTTTSGTFQDTEGMWYSNFLIAKQLYVEILLKLREIADVHFVYNPSNHDYTHGFFLADVIQTYFRNSDNITFDCSIAHRKYFVYGENLIGTTHGDGGKVETLPLTMAHESKDWSSCKHRYIYTHHVHHKVAKDYMGVSVESLRSPSGSDSWHHRNQYQHSPKAIEGFIHSKEHGQVARITHLF